MAEEMMTYTNRLNDDDNKAFHNNDPLHGHFPAPIPQDYFFKRPQCVICSMQESMMRKIQIIKRNVAEAFQGVRHI
eukprot:2425772-Ditylum_brightwellii.AAC.1